MKGLYCEDPRRLEQGSAVALGFFDGVHRGHRAVIQAVLDSKPLVPCVFTFLTDHLKPTSKQKSLLLTSFSRKRELLQEMGVYAVYALFFEEIVNLSAEDFVQKILVETLHAQKVTCGEDYRFGKGAKGDVEVLKTLCQIRGITVEVVPYVYENGKKISSTWIRSALEEGNLEEANRLLGYSYGYRFPVEHGDGRGHKNGVPTINQRFPERFIIPKSGVYASRVEVQGRWYPAVTYIGCKPTVGGSTLLSESFLFSFTGTLYEEEPAVTLLRYLRGEKTFANLQELYGQIEKDKQAALAALKEKN